MSKSVCALEPGVDELYFQANLRGRF